MDIAAMAMNLKAFEFHQQVGIAVANLVMDTIETNVEDMVQVMEQSVNPHLGANLDIRL